MPSARPSRREVVAQLANAQKSNRGAAGYTRWVNRPVGRQLAASCYLAGLTPNQVSAISAAFTFSGLTLLGLLRPTWWLGVIVALALLVGYAFDSADGQVARLRGDGSAAGEWLDHVIDALKTSTIHALVAVMWFRHYHLRPAWLLVPLGFGVVGAVFFFAIVLADLLRRIERVKSGGTHVTTASVNPNEPAPVLRSLIVLPNDYGVLALSMLLIPWQCALVSVYTVLFACNVLFLIAGSVRWFRDLNDDY